MRNAEIPVENGGKIIEIVYFPISLFWSKVQKIVFSRINSAISYWVIAKLDLTKSPRSVFSRAQPEDKIAIVQSLQRQNEARKNIYNRLTYF